MRKATDRISLSRVAISALLAMLFPYSQFQSAYTVTGRESTIPKSSELISIQKHGARSPVVAQEIDTQAVPPANDNFVTLTSWAQKLD